MKRRILILGGTSEARQLAARLAQAPDLDVTMSLAGRTASPIAQPVPTRIGGFGGNEGLAEYLREQRVAVLVDATHPFAARISANARHAAEAAGVPLVTLRRPPWAKAEDDRWTVVEDVDAAVAALGVVPRRVFLTIGRQEAGAFEGAPQHAYLVRSVDPVEPPLTVPDVTCLLARGPFGEAEELALLEQHRIDVIVAKNSGGEATYGKIAAARRRGIEVVMVERPQEHHGAVATVDEAVEAVVRAVSGIDRGV